MVGLFTRSIHYVKTTKNNLLFNFSTTENITIFIWIQLEEQLRIINHEHSCVLHEVKIFETEKNICIYRGETC